MTPLTKARVILLMPCQKSCPWCCNHQPQLIGLAHDIDRIEDIGEDWAEILLSGGEPCLNMGALQRVLEGLQPRRAEGVKVYLYTAVYRPGQSSLLPLLDGVQYTVHYLKDLPDFVTFQREVAAALGFSFRLGMGPEIRATDLPVDRHLWSRIEGWSDQKEKGLPPGEKLFRLRRPYGELG